MTATIGMPSRRRTTPRRAPAHRPRLIQIRDNLTDRITEAEREGWLGEVKGLKISLTSANDQLDQLDQLDRRLPGTSIVDLGIPHQ